MRALFLLIFSYCRMYLISSRSPHIPKRGRDILAAGTTDVDEDLMALCLRYYN
jgi:hypothetical protein